MKIKFLYAFFLVVVNYIFPVFSFSQEAWIEKPFDQKVFIQNKGQFDKKNVTGNAILFGVHSDYQLYFSKNGFTIRYDIAEIGTNDKAEAEIEERENESDEDRLIPTTKTIIACYEWLDISADVKITALDIAPGIFNYADADGRAKDIYNCKAYKKIIYENIYEGIDLEFVFHPKEGIKYSYIVHPFAEVSTIKMKYISDEEPKLLNGKIHLATEAGEIVEQAPVAFYKANQEIIQSSFILNDNIVSFHLRQYDKSQAIIIDPWIIIPALPSTTNNKAYEVQKDAAGNVYVYGVSSPLASFVLNKYDPLGAIVWSLALPFTDIAWAGDLLVDDSGFSYVTDATATTTDNIAKVDNASGTIVLTAKNGKERYRLVYNCDKTKFYTVGGTLGKPPAIEINPATLAATYSTSLAIGKGEVKTIARSPNGNYYFITNDSCQCLFAADSSFNILWNTPSGYAYPYWILNYFPTTGGFNHIAVNGKFIYTYNGILLMKKDICNGALLTSVNVPSGMAHYCGGLMLDSCGNVYAGSMDGIYKYDANLSLITSTVTFAPGAATATVSANSGYGANGSHTGVAFTGGTGTGAVATIVISAAGSITSVAFTNPGSGYTVGDILTPVIGSGTPTITFAAGTQADVTLTPAPVYDISEGINPGELLACGKGFVASINMSVCQPVPFSSACQPVLTASATITNSSCGTLCTGTASINPAGTAPFEYSWSPGGQTTATITGLCAGTYSVYITDRYTKICAPLTVIINQSLTPTVTFSVTNSSSCTANDGSITTTISGGILPYTYLWNNGQTTATVTGLVQGTYTFTVTDSNGCTHTAVATVSCPNAMTQLSQQSDFTIYPNPTSGIFQIRNDALQITNIEILNVLGETILQKTVIQKSETINLKDAPAGIYFLHVKTPNGVVVRKIVKE